MQTFYVVSLHSHVLLHITDMPIHGLILLSLFPSSSPMLSTVLFLTYQNV